MATLATLPTARLATPVPSKRPTRQRIVTCSKRDHASGGIHDPLGVGQGEKYVKKLDQSQEEQRRLMQQRLAQQSHQPGGAKANAVGSLEAAAERELLAVEAEKAQQERPKSLQSIEADEEYKHMHPVQKFILEAKAALYAWTGTGAHLD